MGKKILIVDDVDFIIEFEEKVIISLANELSIEIDIDSASSVAQALNKIEHNQYDAMVVDMNLPDGSGVDIAKFVQEKSPETRIAALTIRPDKYEEYNVYFDAFFKKPILPHAYRKNIRKLLSV